MFARVVVAAVPRLQSTFLAQLINIHSRREVDLFAERFNKINEKFHNVIYHDIDFIKKIARVLLFSYCENANYGEYVLFTRSLVAFSGSR